MASQQPQGQQDIEKQKEIWKLEQLQIHQQVQVYPDAAVNCNNNNNNNKNSIVHDRLECLPSILPPPPHNNNHPKKEEDVYYYGGVDVSFPEDENDQGVAVYVILDATTMKLVYEDHEFFHVNDVPYVPSYLAFREIAPLERLINKQKKIAPQWTPRAILVDGNGLLHSRGAGIACFVGVRTNLPTIGIGKTLYCEGGLTKQLVHDGIQQSLRYIHETVSSTGEETKHTSDTTAAATTTIATTGDTHNNGFIIIDRQSIHDHSGTNINNNNNTNHNKNANNDSNHLNKSNLDKKDDTNNNTVHITPNSRNNNENQNNNDTTTSKDQNKATLDVSQIIANARIFNGVSSSSSSSGGCHGIGIPLEVNDGRGVLAYALVGHGGRVTTGKNNKTSKATKNPIYVSVGHQISLLEAVRTTASLCWSKIPEPVRQADLIGREHMRIRMRQQKQQQQQQQ